MVSNPPDRNQKGFVIDSRKFVSGRNRIVQKEIVCQSGIITHLVAACVRDRMRNTKGLGPCGPIRGSARR